MTTAGAGTDVERARGVDDVSPSGEREYLASVLTISAPLLALGSVALLAAVMVLGPPAVSGGPLWSAPARLSPGVVNAMEAAGLLLGGLAVADGLLAVHRGWRPSIRLLLGVGIAVTALFAFLPPIGSDTDVLNYAVYGRILTLGHNPYVMTPDRFYHTHDPVGLLAPGGYWRTWPTVYGPVATALQGAAARAGGASMARIVFWIKLGNGIAFVSTALGLLRLAGTDRGRQARVCLLWVVNPLMLFWLVGGGHLDVLLALLAVSTLLVMRSHLGSTSVGAVMTGLVIGVAMAIKTPFALAALGMAWAARRSPRTIALAAVGAAAVFIPCYLLPGVGNSGILIRRLTWNASFLHLPGFISSNATLFTAIVLLVGLGLAALLLWRIPEGNPDLPGVRPAAALVLAYLAAFPTPGPWYVALMFPLLALLPDTWLSYVVIALCLLQSEVALDQHIHLVYTLGRLGVVLVWLTLVVLCLLNAWGLDRAEIRHGDARSVAG